MNQRPFGRTGLAVSEIGFGSGPAARLMVAGDPAEQARLVARALEAGINYFDTAARYGNGASETNLGRVLRELSADPVIASKVALGADDLADPGAAVERSVEGSLRRLGRERLDILHLHNRVGAERADRSNIGPDLQLGLADVLGPNGIAEGCERLRQRGLVGVVGCSAYGGEILAVEALVESGAFGSILVNYSLLNPTAWSPAPDAVDVDYGGIGAHAARAGLAVVALRVLEGGVLAGRDSADDRLHRLRFVLEDAADYAEAAIRFALANREIATVLIGISSEAQLDAALAAARQGPLSAPPHRRAT